MLSLIKYFPNFLKKKNIKNPNIIVPAVGWSTSYYPVSQCGFKLKFVDINLKTLNIDIEKVELAIDKNTVAVLPINLLGNPEFILKVPNSSSNLDIKLGNDINVGWNSTDSRALDPK